MSDPRTVHIVRFEHGDVHEPAPWPVGIRSNLQVYAGLGPGTDGAYLVGFKEPGDDNPIDTFAEAGIAEPESVAGKHMVFSDGENFFTWALPVRTIESATPEQAEADMIPVPEKPLPDPDFPGEIDG